MLKTLLRVQIAGMLHSFYARNKLSRAGKAGGVLLAVLMAYCFGVFGFMFGMLYKTVYEPFHAAGYMWLYYALGGIFAFCLSFVFSVFLAASLLYQAKDNELLLSMPIPPWMIMTCRVAMLWFTNLLTCALTLLPAAIVHWTQEAPDAVGVQRFLFGFLSMPFLCTALSCLFGYLVSAATARMRRKNIATLIFSLLFLAAYLFVYTQAGGYVRKIAEKSAQFAEALEKGVFPAYHFGTAVAEGGISLLYWLLCCAAPFLVALWALSRSFMRMCAQTERAPKVKFDKNREISSRSMPWSLTVKELGRLWSSANYMLNGCLGALFAVGIPILLWVKSDVMYMIAAGEFGSVRTDYISGIHALALCFSCTMIMVSASSVSLEGKSYWITRSLPVPTWEILLAKVRAHLIIALPAGWIGAGISCAALKPDAATAIALFLLPTALNVFMAHAGAAINVRHPRLDWTSEAMVVKQSLAVLLDMLTGYAVILAMALVYVFLLSGQSIGLYMLAWAALLAAGACLLRKYLYRGGSARYERLG